MGMLSNIGSMAGGIVGGIFGGPIGAQIGQAIGGQIGSMLEQLIGQFGSQNTSSGMSNSANNQACETAHDAVSGSGLPQQICDQLHNFIDSLNSSCQQPTPPDCQNSCDVMFAMFAKTS
jgi:predicted lipid-binding transport protein (Tim44 family)